MPREVEESMGDLVGDLHHLADEQGFAWAEIERRGAETYGEERDPDTLTEADRLWAALRSVAAVVIHDPVDRPMVLSILERYGVPMPLPVKLNEPTAEAPVPYSERIAAELRAKAEGNVAHVRDAYRDAAAYVERRARELFAAETQRLRETL